MKQDVSIFADMKIPDDYRRVEAFTNGSRIIVCDQEAWPLERSDESHNCDFAGCGTFSHVVASGHLKLEVSLFSTTHPAVKAATE